MYDYYNSTCGNKEDSDAGHTSDIIEMKQVVQFDFVETGYIGQKLKGDSQSSTALVTWLCYCSTPADGH